MKPHLLRLQETRSTGRLSLPVAASAVRIVANNTPQMSPRLQFKLEPYSPHTPSANEISKVETVLSLGSQKSWTEDGARTADSGRRKRDRKREEGERRTETERKREEGERRAEREVWERRDVGLHQLQLQVDRLREENRKLLHELKDAQQTAVRYKSLEHELEHLHCQLDKMTDSRAVYERATTQLVSFLDLVTNQLSIATAESRPDSVLDHLPSHSVSSMNLASSLDLDPAIPRSRRSLGGAESVLSNTSSRLAHFFI